MAKRKGTIKKSINRKISTAQFESIDIYEEVIEEVEWDTEAERIKISGEVSKSLFDNFTETYTQAMEIIGVERCLAKVKMRKGVPAPGKDKKESDKDDSLAFLDE
jgi:hypothetical protein